MSYLGNTPTQQNFVAGADQFSGTGSQTVFTLSRVVNTVFDIFVTVSNVPQDPFTAYTISGNTLTFDSAPPSGTNNIDVVYRATNVQYFVPSPGSTVGGPFGIQGNLNFFGTGNRITGDFSNATIANRVAFQTSTVNGASDIPVIPNGTGTNARHFYYSSSDTANASLLTAGVVGTEATFRASAVGSGTSPAMTFYTGGSEQARITTAGLFQFNSGYGSVATAYGCRAWVNFNGTGTVAIRASGNVTSITDNNNGDYTVNFTTAMPDANYATVITTNRSSGNTTLVNISRIADELSAPTVSSVRIAQGVPDASRVLQREDASFIMVSIFR